ncbi:MAG: serine/threonine protein kinase, partial [Acidobacteriota bacterium]|nr:serine/threonine protein kinase [Acidobacteriota bacterium]
MPSPTFAPGHDLVGRYRIARLLGVGHVAEVYLADDLSLRRQIVVKVLLSHLAAYEDVRRAFRDRIVRSATLSHPHLERVYDGGQESGHIFTITEYLEGGSLEEVLAAGRRLSLDDTARLGRDVAGALAYLNTNGFVHGALSPNTLLFDAEGHVRVSDVALSGLAGMHGEALTYDEVRYLSPEQALGEPAGDRSDVYALALILFEAATGSSPFEEMTPEAMLRTRVNTALPVRPELGTLDMVLAQAAVPDPRLRLDADQFANRLGAAAADSSPLTLSLARDGAPLLAQFPSPEPRRSIGFRPPSPDQIVSIPAGARHAAPPSRPRDDLAGFDDRRGRGPLA